MSFAGRRLGTAVTLVLVVALAGCTGPSTVPTAVPAGSNTPESTSASSSTAEPVGSTPESPPTVNEPSLPPGLQGLIPEDIFTRPADPLTLTITTDSNASAAEIGSEGGEVTATGADGASYRLEIPAGALALLTEITMSPITSVVGIPDEAGAEKTYGVLFEPNGLQLAKPATLTITLPEPLGTEPAAMLSFEGSGEEAGFYDFDQSSTGITTEVDHFSGLVFQSPFQIDSIPPTLRMKFYSQSEAEARLTSEIASALEVIKQQQMLGIEDGLTAVELAQSALGAFKRLVISPRVAAADKSCWNATHAMEAYLDYQRQRQKLGVGDDPAFDLVGAGYYVPAALVDLAVDVCFKEAYESCIKTGDFPSLSAFYLTFFERAELLAGAPTAAHIAIATDYLKRCGRWRVKLATTIDDPDVGISPYHNEATREFHIQWKPSQGLYNMIGSTITGSGEVDQTKITHEGACAPATITNIHSGHDSIVQLARIAFDHYEGPTLTGDPIQPVPTQLVLDVNLGLGVHDLWCNKPDGAEYEGVEEEFGALYIVLSKDQGTPLVLEDLLVIDTGDFSSKILKGWQFQTSPYRAVNVIEGRWDIGSGPGGHAYQDGRLEVIVEHEPQ